jgi:outer membrane receptor for ferrienterochelin and colicins
MKNARFVSAPKHPLLVLHIRHALAVSCLLAPGTVLAQADPGVEEIVVTAGSYAQSLRTAPASISVISDVDLRERNVTDILQAVRETQGITMDPTGGSSNRSSVSVRGMGRDYSLMLVNGRRLSASDEVIQHSDFRFDWLPMELIDRVEIVRGPMSSLYGSEAFGGVINVITKPADERWFGNFRAQQGGQIGGSGGDEFNASAAAAGPVTENLSVTIGASHFSRTDMPYPDDTRSPALSLREGKRGSNLVVGSTFQLNSQQSLSLDLSRAEEERGSYRLETVTGGGFIYKNSGDISRNHVALGWKGDFQRFSARLGAYESEVTNTTSFNDARVPPSKSPTQGQRSEVIDGGLVFPLGDSHTLSTGFESMKQYHVHKSFLGGEAEAGTFSAYIQDEIVLADPLRLTVGLRSDEHDTFGSELSPRTYLVYLPSDNMTVKLGYGHGFKAPHLKYTTPGYESGRPGYDLIANPDLAPEVVDGYELGVDYRLGAMQINLVAFINELEDLLVSEDLTLPVRVRGQVVKNGTSRRVNVDEARIKGTELSFSMPLGSQFDISLNHTWLDGENKSTGQALTERPKHAANARLGWDGGRGWSAQLRANYVGEQFQLVGRGAAAVMQTLPDYTYWNISAARELNSTMTLRAGVDNLTDLNLLEESALFTYADRGRYAYFSIEARFN